MGDKIAEIGNSVPTVESVIARLSRETPGIKSITAIIEWDDNSNCIVHEEKSLQRMALELLILQDYITKSLNAT